MIDIIQIYKSKEYFTKASYTPENRKVFHDLQASYDSTQGYLEGRTLILPRRYEGGIDIKNTDLIIIQDIKGWESFMANKSVEGVDLPRWYNISSRDHIVGTNITLSVLKQVNSLKSFEYFKIRKLNEDSYELHIDYTSNSSWIGLPVRENHKICNLKEFNPIRYRINGKSDFTMTGRKERSFYEYDYIIQWIGKADKIEFKDLNKIHKTKALPLESCKLIDERKILK